MYFFFFYYLFAFLKYSKFKFCIKYFLVFNVFSVNINICFSVIVNIFIEFKSYIQRASALKMN